MDKLLAWVVMDKLAMDQVELDQMELDQVVTNWHKA